MNKPTIPIEDLWPGDLIETDSGICHVASIEPNPWPAYNNAVLRFTNRPGVEYRAWDEQVRLL